MKYKVKAYTPPVVDAVEVKWDNWAEIVQLCAGFDVTGVYADANGNTEFGPDSTPVGSTDHIAVRLMTRNGMSLASEGEFIVIENGQAYIMDASEFGEYYEPAS